jgi:hypothetical protein
MRRFVRAGKEVGRDEMGDQVDIELERRSRVLRDWDRTVVQVWEGEDA